MPTPDELEATWQEVRAELRGDVTDLTFHLWLEPLKLAWQERGVLHVRAPRHIRTFVEERYLPLLTRAASRALDDRIDLQLVGEDWVAPAGSRSVGSSHAHADSGLNARYTFEQFVIGDGNRLAHLAALAVAELPGQAYNPLFIHGPPGLGKTHLLHAIGNYLRAHSDGLAVRYATGETFTNDFVRALRDQTTADFKGRFRRTDVLLLDDVQFLASKVKTEEEFFHTFNALYESGAQLVLTSDRSPVDMEALETRLQERFAAGLVASLEPPSPAVRLTILRKRVAVDPQIDIDDETLREVASRVTSSVRALEGALIRVVAYASLSSRAATPELARQALERIYPHGEWPAPTVERVQDATAAAYDLDRAALLAHTRQPHITFARQVAMYLARELTEESLPAIGKHFGGRNHSTILHAHRKIAGEVADGKPAAQTVEHLRQALAHSRR